MTNETKTYCTDGNYVGFHWFSFSFPTQHSSLVMTDLYQWVESIPFLHVEKSYERMRNGLNGYQFSESLCDGMLVYSSDHDQDHHEEVHNNKSNFFIRGEFFDLLGYDMSAKLFQFIGDNFGSFMTVKRMDDYYQDVNRIIEMWDLLCLWKNGQARGFCTRRYIESETRLGDEAATLELGRRGQNGSGKFMRIYDKDLESDGEIKGIRWECEWTGDKADAKFWILYRNGFSKKTVAGMIFAASDWIERTDQKHRKRWKRLDWYEAMIDGMERVKVSVKIDPTNIDKKKSWLEHSVSGTLAYVRAFIRFTQGTDDGFDYELSELLEKGSKKMNKRLVAQLKLDIENYRDKDVPLPSDDEIEAFLEVAA